MRAVGRAGRAGMGLALGKRVGSDPYYASYERSFEHLSSELHRLEVRYKPASAPWQALRALTAVCACLGTGGSEEGPAPGDREGYRQLWPGRLCAGGSVRDVGMARQQGHNLWRVGSRVQLPAHQLGSGAGIEAAARALHVTGTYPTHSAPLPGAPPCHCHALVGAELPPVG